MNALHYTIMKIRSGFVGPIHLLVVFLFLWNAVTVRGQSNVIPQPLKIDEGKGSFQFNPSTKICIDDEQLRFTGQQLANEIEKISGFEPALTRKIPGPAGNVVLLTSKLPANAETEEGYLLSVTRKQVRISAAAPAGIFYGMQTLLQLLQENGAVNACTITDRPAFKWRGYMVDVGRNFQSMAQLKQQIDVMSRYKMNVFHFHLTEDVAWRLQIKAYPQLTQASAMTRNQGKFYTTADLQELIRYCKERHIMLVPEIDMPGHSAAFTRAMGFNMQSEKGLAAVKEILKEICSTYDVPYLHIGADEVLIRNKQFLPELSKLIRSYGKSVIAWAPGGNYDALTLRQLWKDEGKNETAQQQGRYIDSHGLYISDMDPLNTVVTLFNRQFSGKLGAEFCLWNDRKVADEKELISRNAVYPGMLAFAERSWRGGGYAYAFHIGFEEPRAKAFAEFEQRLLIHKERYFSQMPFNYVKQTDISWKLIGPFPNEGQLDRVFKPESAELSAAVSGIAATGGTVWLWHTNGPEVKAWLPELRRQSTWYATSRFYSKTDTVLQFWIDFKDQSRSGADATPAAGQWDYLQSRIWLNGQLIEPPEWKYPGRPKGLLEAPLEDESFYYREPVAIQVKAGWNKVLVKLPIGNFEKNDWQTPPKWMFTFIPVVKKGTNWDRFPLIFNPDYE